MTTAKLQDVGKRFGQVQAVRGVSVTIEAGTCLGILGRSGSGKTTLLRLLSGLESPDEGRVELLDSAGKLSRPGAIGMVFQNLGLWPHLTAWQHVECVLPATANRSSASKAIEDLLAEVQLPRETWDRRPAQLSGGEGQRLALARALACDPQLLLLDEPLAHLDAPLRAEMLELLMRVLRKRRLTCVYVTHAWSEAAELCQRIGVLECGRMEQLGSPDELYWQPASRDIAQLTGPVLSLPRAWLDEGRVGGDPKSPGWAGLVQPNDESSQLWLRPQQLQLTAAAGANRWRIVSCSVLGAAWKAHLESEGRTVSVLRAAPCQVDQWVGLQICGNAVCDTR